MSFSREILYVTRLFPAHFVQCVISFKSVPEMTSDGQKERVMDECRGGADEGKIWGKIGGEEEKNKREKERSGGIGSDSEVKRDRGGESAAGKMAERKQSVRIE